MVQQETKDRSNRDRTYSITELCREFDVTPRTLRFYEQKGLLHPARRGWTRLFSYRDRARLQLILRGKKVGFALEEIKEIGKGSVNRGLTALVKAARVLTPEGIRKLGRS